jgi:hypothetical protein
MPGFPIQIVGTPTNRGKARRYGGKEKADPSRRGGLGPVTASGMHKAQMTGEVGAGG